MQLMLATKSKADKKSSGEKTSFSACSSPEDKTGAPAGLPLFLQRLTRTAVAPPTLQRQPMDVEEEELLQPKPADAAIQLRSHKEPELAVQQMLKDATLQRQIEVGEDEEEEPIQAKPAISKPDDIEEQEANRVADEILDGGVPRSDLSPPRNLAPTSLHYSLHRKSRPSPEGDASKRAASWQPANDFGTGQHRI